MRYTTTLVTPFNQPCELVAPGVDWRYRDMRFRQDNVLVIVWETDKPRACSCADPACPGGL